MKPGRDERENESTLNAKPRNWATNQAARPLPLVFGKHRLGGTFISDLFSTRAKPIYSTYGGGGSLSLEAKVITGYNYYGSFALALCHGPISKVFEVWANGVRIWDGETDLDDDDPADLDTDIGTIRLYPGTAGQDADSDLGHDVAYRHVCYAVADGVHFGQSPTPPNLEFVISRVADGLALSEDELSDDGIVPEIVYDIITSPVYGCGVDDGFLDTDSFEAAAEEIIGEDLGVSPEWRAPTTFRQALADLLQYVGGAVYYSDGKLRWRQFRDEAATVELSEDDLAEEPTIDRESWPETRNEVRLSFTDRSRDFEANNVTATDMAAAQALGYFACEELSRPWVTRKGVAKRLAIAAQQLLGVPGCTVELHCLSTTAGLVPGARADLDYAPLGISSMPLRVLEVEHGDPSQPTIRVKAIEDVSRLAEASYVPGDEDNHDATEDEPTDCTFRV